MATDTVNATKAIDQIAEITNSVAEAQSVLHLVHGQLNPDSPPAGEQIFQLYTAMALALRRLDQVHNFVFAMRETAADLSPT